MQTSEVYKETSTGQRFLGRGERVECQIESEDFLFLSERAPGTGTWIELHNKETDEALGRELDGFERGVSLSPKSCLQLGLALLRAGGLHVFGGSWEPRTKVSDDFS